MYNECVSWRVVSGVFPYTFSVYSVRMLRNRESPAIRNCFISWEGFMKIRWLRPLTLTIIFCLLTGLPAAAQPAGPLVQADQVAAPASDPGASLN